MNERDRILGILRESLPELAERYRLRRLSLFGSVARGEQNPMSDIDLLVEFDDRATLLDLVDLGECLERRLGRRVDLGTPASLHPAIRAQALAEMVTV